MIETIIIFAVCLTAGSWRAYKIGLRDGSSRTIDQLHEKRIIRYDHEGNIRPNEWFDA